MESGPEIVQELQRLRLQNAKLREEIRSLRSSSLPSPSPSPPSSSSASSSAAPGALDAQSIRRYSRQLLVPQFGVTGQQNLLKSSILVVGAGGLGSPVALYLAAAGIGCLGIVDHDNVEVDNLHRQVIHSESWIGGSKVQSAARACNEINSKLKVVEHNTLLDSSNSVDIFKQYDVIVDATDNVPTRYLISDTCVALGKPLVSGAALGMDGQLTTYNYAGGPCYRCLFPVPPPQGACQRCSDSGVLGVVPGIIGCLQALEAIKIASGVGEPLAKRMLILDAYSTNIRVVKLRGRNPDCTVCGDASRIKVEDICHFNYEEFTGSLSCDKAPIPLEVLPSVHRISAKEYSSCLEKGLPHLLLDVREPHQYLISALPHSMNVPLSGLKSKLPEIEVASQKAQIIVICRRGNDSQLAVELLRENGYLDSVDITGGLESWARDVDPEFPIY